MRAPTVLSFIFDRLSSVQQLTREPPSPRVTLPFLTEISHSNGRTKIVFPPFDRQRAVRAGGINNELPSGGRRDHPRQKRSTDLLGAAERMPGRKWTAAGTAGLVLRASHSLLRTSRRLEGLVRGPLGSTVPTRLAVLFRWLKTGITRRNRRPELLRV